MIFGIAPAIAPVVGALLLRAGGWRGIFWSLAVFATLLALVSAWWLRESHPVSLRHPFAPKALLETYRRIGSEPRFCALAHRVGLRPQPCLLHYFPGPRPALVGFAHGDSGVWSFRLFAVAHVARS